MHKTDEHKWGMGRSKKNAEKDDQDQDKQNTSNMAAFDLGFCSAFQQG